MSDVDLASLGRVGGWASGSYYGKCRLCDHEFTGDKRACECLPCAVTGLQNDVTKMTKALRDINRLNDHPGYFNSEVQKVLDAVIDTSDVAFPIPSKWANSL